MWLAVAVPGAWSPPVTPGRPAELRGADRGLGCHDEAVNTRRLPPPVPVTALRVYEPLEAFAAGQRAGLAARATDPRAGSAAEAAERAASWHRLLGRRADGMRTDAPAYARVLRVGGVVLLAPVDGETRQGPPEGAGDESGVQARDRSGRDLDRCHTLVRAWEIPPAWLTLVRTEDLTRSGGRGRYVLPMSRARARAARALRALRSRLGVVDLTLDVELLARWLEQFHPRSWVELDTRPVAALVDGEDGAEDVRLGLESLTAGDVAGLAAAYRRVSRRSHRLEQLSVSS